MTNNIQHYREDRGYPQWKLARLVRVSQQAIDRYEKGLSDPSLRTAFRLAHALDTDINALFDWKSDEPKER